MIHCFGKQRLIDTSVLFSADDVANQVTFSGSSDDDVIVIKKV